MSCTEASTAAGRTCAVAGNCTVARSTGIRNSSTRKSPDRAPCTQPVSAPCFGPANVTEYSPSLASFGTGHVDSAVPSAFHASGSSQR